MMNSALKQTVRFANLLCTSVGSMETYRKKVRH
jgi:hypothetical protein